MHTAVESIENTSSEAAAPGPAVDINALFCQHQVHLLRFVRRYLRNEEDAQDVVQNTFLEAIRCADRFSGLSKPSTWLFGIALNLARNQVRCNCTSLMESIDESVLEQVADYNADPAVLIEQRQIAGKVDALLDSFPAEIRETFEAVYDGDSTYEEAAKQLQVPVGTVRSRVSRVRATARARFE